jgi:uncharacterized protein (TIGR02453 family)
MLTQNAVDFIEDLKHNNNTDWMHANKNRYEDFKKDYHNWIQSLLQEMKQLDQSLAVLEIKNCTFRINRDIRFSKNKQPYKTNIGMWMSVDRSNKNAPGYYIHFEKDNSFIAGGCWCPEPDQLKKIRTEIAFFTDDFEIVLNDKNFKKDFFSLTFDEKNTLKNVPKGFEPNHKAADFLKMKTFTASQKIEDKIFTQKDSSKVIAQKIIALKPLNEFLNRALQTEV